MYQIIDYSLNGQKVYWDGYGFSCHSLNAKNYELVDAIRIRSAICHEFPDCRISP